MPTNEDRLAFYAWLESEGVPDAGITREIIADRLGIPHAVAYELLMEGLNGGKLKPGPSKGEVHFKNMSVVRTEAKRLEAVIEFDTSKAKQPHSTEKTDEE